MTYSGECQPMGACDSDSGPEDASGVSEEMRGLSNALDRLDLALGDLGARLGPVSIVGKEEPGAATKREGAVTDTQERSPLEWDIRTAAERVGALSDRAAALAHRLRVG